MGQDSGWAAPGAAGGPPGSGSTGPSGGPPSWNPPPAPPTHGGWGPAPGASGPWAGPPRPGIVPLRPLGVWELFEGGFRAIRDNPKVMLGVSALVFGVVAVITLVLDLLLSGPVAGAVNSFAEGATDGEVVFTSDDLLGINPLSMIISFVATTALTGVLVLSVSRSVIGQQISPGEVWRKAKPRILPLIGLTLLTSIALPLIVLVAAVPGIVVLVLGDGVVGGILLAVGLLLGILAAIWIGVAWSFSSVVLLLENKGVIGSLRRSWQLVRGTWWRVFGILLLTQVLVGIAASILVGPGALLGGVIGLLLDGTGGAVLSLFVSLLASAIASTLTQPFLSAVTALLYTDVRMRREGLDVELARAAGATS